MSIRSLLRVTLVDCARAAGFLPIRTYFAIYNPNVTGRAGEGRKVKGKNGTHVAGNSKPGTGKAPLLVAIGDSIAAGTDSFTLCFGSRENFAAYLSRSVKADFRNLSMPDATSADALRQAERAPQADIIAILVGANDVFSNGSPADYRQNLRAIVSIAKSKAKNVIVVGLPDFSFLRRTRSWRCAIVRSILFMFGMLAGDREVEAGFREFDSIARSVALSQGVAFANIYGMDFSEEDLGFDCFHPGRQGHRRIAEKAYGEMKKFYDA